MPDKKVCGFDPYLPRMIQKKSAQLSNDYGIIPDLRSPKGRNIYKATFWTDSRSNCYDLIMRSSFLIFLQYIYHLKNPTNFFVEFERLYVIEKYFIDLFFNL